MVMALQKQRIPRLKPTVSSERKVIYVRPKTLSAVNRNNRAAELSRSSSVDVIDLGGPRLTPPPPRPRLRTPYTPNPRLYPGATASSSSAPKRKHKAAGAGRRGCGRGVRGVRGPLPPPCAMDATRHSTSPECSEGADATSAPSEFLAEFLSAIMRRQYAEALKFCRLILQYEPDNATARSFYPLLRHKLHENSESGGGESLSGSSGAPQSRSSSRSRSHSRSHSHSCSRSRHGARWSEGGSVSSQSSLELDWSGERADDVTDDNGNDTQTAAASLAATAAARSDDLENDNDVASFKSSSSLRRLRAQFACSIK